MWTDFAEIGLLQRAAIDVNSVSEEPDFGEVGPHLQSGYVAASSIDLKAWHERVTEKS
jgi:hypothetical protein